MEPRSKVLKPQGFTLIEVLISISLVTVVMSLAWIVLESVRQVAEEIERPIESAVEPFWYRLQNEFDHLLLHPSTEDTPALRFSIDEGLKFISLLPNQQGIPQETFVHYYVEDNQLMKITRSGYPTLSETSIVAEAISEIRSTALVKQESFAEWPPEEEKPLPPIIQVELEANDRTLYVREFFLPASIRAEGQ